MTSKWKQLQELVINAAPTPAEWREISTLPHLSRLVLGQYDLAQATPIHGVTYLHLAPIDSDTQLDLVPEIFPNVKKIYVNCRASLPDITDITPLKRIKELTISLSCANHVVGREEFSPEAVHLYPRPRTEII